MASNGARQETPGQRLFGQIITGIMVAVVSFTMVAQFMNVTWSEHPVLGVFMSLFLLAACGFTLWVTSLWHTQRWVWALCQFGWLNLGVIMAFYVDSMSEEHVVQATRTAKKMTRELQATVKSVQGIDWLKPGERCTVVVTGQLGLRQWMDFGWSETTSTDPARLGPCRIQVRCGQGTLYGAGNTGHIARCQVGDKGGLSVEDLQGAAIDNDPQMRFSSRDRLVKIHDDAMGASPPYQVRLQLSQPADGTRSPKIPR